LPLVDSPGRDTTTRARSLRRDLLEDAADLPLGRVHSEQMPRRTGKELIDACAKVRGALTDEEVDTLSSRTPSFARPVDFE